VRTQLQCAADSAAIAGASAMADSCHKAKSEAQRFARYHIVGGKPCELSEDEIELGVWVPKKRQFQSSEGGASAIRVTASVKNHELFFGKGLGLPFFSTGANSGASVNSVAVAKPRDIVFVLDMSGRMNDESEVAKGATKDSALEMQHLFDDLNFGTYPGTEEVVGAPLGIELGQDILRQLVGWVEPTVDGKGTQYVPGLLGSPTTPPEYLVLESHEVRERFLRAYKWIIEQHIAGLMPRALPDPRDPQNFDYWREYVDYVLLKDGKAIIDPPTSTTSKKQKKDGLLDLVNDLLSVDCSDKKENATRGKIDTLRNRREIAEKMADKVSYLSYLQFMLDMGTDNLVAGQHVPLSVAHASCPMHLESTNAGTLSFPPRMQPEHAIRRSLVDAIKLIDDLNDNDLDEDRRDRVAVILYNRSVNGDGNAKLVVPLTGDYRRALEECTRLQSAGDDGRFSAVEEALGLAHQHLSPLENGGDGRDWSKKVVFLLNGSRPDSYRCSSNEVKDHIVGHDDGNFYRNNKYEKDGALMHASKMRLKKWTVSLIGMGIQVDPDFLNRAARVSLKKGEEPYLQYAKTRSDYEQILTQAVLDSQHSRVSLVQ
jgi:hypothetical protein